MNNLPENMEEILKEQICGFHQYILTPHLHLQYVSQNLCQMLGCAEKELVHGRKDLYAGFVHPEDRKKYSSFIENLIEKKEKANAEYRLVRKDGQVIYVRDTMTVKNLEDGQLAGYSVLTDITELEKRNEDLRFMDATIPCGFLRYTCEKQPRVTYINQKMIDFLRFPQKKEGEIDYLEMYKSNIFLMIPMEERRRFSKYLNRVYSSEVPLAGDITLLRCDGSRAHLFGWVAKCINKEGKEEFQTVCIDVTERYQARKTNENRRYLKALSDVYDKIFEFNLDSNTVKCIHCSPDSSFKRFENMAVQIGDAVDKWLITAAAPEEQDQIRQFFMDFCQRKLVGSEGKPPQITYHAKSADDRLREYTGLFIKVDEAVSFYCCRQIQSSENTAALKLENAQLKESMRDLAMQFSDGIAAFEISPQDMVKPLYASDNVCEFFGYTSEEWLAMTESYTPLDNFIAKSEAAYEDFMELLRTGSAEFQYFDFQTETERKIKAVCSEKEANVGSYRYVMLYLADDTKTGEGQKGPEERTVAIRTFGYFDVFVGSNPIAFRNKKSKELFAMLVDRKGGYVTSEEAISFLWEDEPVSTLTLSRYRKVALRLKSTLEEYGISDIMEAVDGKRRVIPEKVDCDLYNYLSGKEEYAHLFKGSYLSNYSWGETTLGELVSES